MEKELEKIVENIEPKSIETINGEKIVLPKITLGKELRIMKRLFGFLKLGGYEDNNKSMWNVLLESISKDGGIECILDIFSIIVDKPTEWVEENIEMKTLLEVLLPFFVERMTRIAVIFPSPQTPPMVLPTAG